MHACSWGSPRHGTVVELVEPPGPSLSEELEWLEGGWGGGVGGVSRGGSGVGIGCRGCGWGPGGDRGGGVLSMLGRGRVGGSEGAFCFGTSWLRWGELK